MSQLPDSQVDVKRPLALTPRKRRAMQLGLILAFGVTLRLWLAISAPVISRDSTAFLEIAKGYASGATVEELSARHPGYSVTLATVRRALVALGGPEGRLGWEIAGRAVSIAAAAGALAAVWILARWAFGDTVALLTGLLLAVASKWAALGAEILSDSLALCLQLWAVVLALAALWNAMRRHRVSAAWALGAGVLSGLGYLVRPEAALPVVLAAGLWAVYCAAGRMPGRWLAGSLATLVLGFAVCAGPYMLAVGGLTSREYFSAAPTARAPLLAWASAYPAPRLLLNQLVEAMHPAWFMLLLVWGVARAMRRRIRRRLARRARLSPRGPLALLMAATAALTFAGVLLRAGDEGVISHRYLAFTAAMLMPLAGRGLMVLGSAAAWLSARAGRPASPARMTAILAVLVIAGVTAHAMRPLHRGKGCYLLAGQFAGREAAENDGLVLAYDPIVLYYAEGPGALLYDDNMRPHPFWHRTMTTGATLLVLSDRRRDANPGVSALVTSDGFEEIAAFPRRKGRRADVVRVYRVRRDELRRRRPHRPG